MGSNAFFQPQYGALTTWSTIANSNYYALAVSLRARTNSLTVDIHYTYPHSLDDASGLQTAGSFSGASLILNPYRQRESYASSDFDMRHHINVSSLYALPLGKGKLVVKGVRTLIHTGSPFDTPYDVGDAGRSAVFVLERSTEGRAVCRAS